MALGWPTNAFGGSASSVVIGADADVIGRADKIIAWVKTKH